jgi:AraC-like DNA-binding protein
MKSWHERRFGNEMITHHMHSVASVALVLSGGYEEAGDRGCFHARSGDVVIHAPYDAHLDRITRAGAHILNLPMRPCLGSIPCFGRIDNPDLIVRVAERNSTEATELVLSRMEEHSIPLLDWPEQLAQALSKNPELRLSDWAQEAGLASATITRGFRQVFGITPSSFRAHSRTKLALNMISNTDVALCRVAADLGFSDQAHMTRALRQLTGKSPSMWRAEGQIDSRHR